MTETAKLLKDFFENSPLYVPVTLKAENDMHSPRYFQLKEIQAECGVCKESKPFHNNGNNNYVIYLSSWENTNSFTLSFECVTCRQEKKRFWIKIDQNDDIITFKKIGQDPQKELSRSKDLSKFFKSDKEEYNKAVICIAHGFGVASFVYMRRIIENNINNLLDMINEDEMIDQNIRDALLQLKDASPMSSKIAIANKALPDYLLIGGHNLLGTMYKVLSEGVHSLSDKECLERTKSVQNCLEYIISGLATHKKNKESVKKDVEFLKDL